MRLLSTRGWLRTIVCRLCGALVVADGEHQHERTHRKETTVGTEKEYIAVRQLTKDWADMTRAEREEFIDSLVRELYPDDEHDEGSSAP